MAQELRPVTILFADVPGYTTLSEQVDVELVTDVLLPCLNRLAAVVQFYGGRVVHSAGDNIMATFGAPTAHEDDPVRAVRCGLAMLQAIDEMAPFCEERLGRRLDLRVGVNTGTVLAGAVGLGATENVRGDPVNVAQRLEAAANPGSAFVSKSTYDQAEWAFRWRGPHTLQVKGRQEAVEAYEAVEVISTLARPRGIANIPTPFLGRDEELATLRRVWSECREGRGRVVSIVGDAGIGKSRLVAEFELSLYADAPPRFVRGVTPPIANQPYGPVIQVLEAVLGRHADDEVGQPGDLLQLLVTAEGVVPEDKRALFERVTALLREQARRHPLVVVLDDLHWADSATVEFVEYFSRRLEDVPLLLILMYRPQGPEPLGREGQAAVIELTPLADEECRRLTELVIGGPLVPPALRSSVVAQADGNPFYLEEVVRTLVQQGVLTYENNQWVCPTPPEDIAVPESLRALLLARLDQLEDGSRQLSREASVLGRNFLSRLLERISRAGGRVQAKLEELVDEGLLGPWTSSPEGPMYGFAHALVRDVAYETLTQRQRIELHLRAAQSIEGLFGDRLHLFAETLAYHYEHAGDRERAAKHYLLAGERAERVHADREARRYREAARRLLGMTSVWSLYAGSEQLSGRVRVGAWALQVGLALIFSLPLLALFMSQNPPPTQVTLGVPLDIVNLSPSVMALAAVVGALPLLLTALGLNQIAVPALLRGSPGWREQAGFVLVAWIASLLAVGLALTVLAIGLRFNWLNETLTNFVGAAVLQLLRRDLSLIATLLLGTLVPSLAWMAWLRLETARWQQRLAAVADEDEDTTAIALGLARSVGTAALLSLVALVLYLLDVLPGTAHQPDPNLALFGATAVVFAAIAVVALGAFFWLRRGRPHGSGAGTLGIELPLVVSLLFGVVFAFTLRQDVVSIANGLFGPGELAGLNRTTTLFPDLAAAHYLKGERQWFKVPAVLEGGQLVPDAERLAEVRDTFSAAIEAEPDFAPPYLARGKILVDLGDTQGALDDANRLIELKPEHPAGYGLRALAFVAMGDIPGAAADLARANEPLPAGTQGWDAYWIRCLTLTFAGRTDEAIADCERSLDLNDRHVPTYDHLGFVYADAGRYEDALRVFDKFADLAPDARSLTNRALMLMYLGRYEDALPDLDEALRYTSDYTTALQYRAETLLFLDEPERALNDARQGTELAPNSRDAHLNRAVVAMYLGDGATVQESVDRLVELGEDEVVVLNVRGYAYALAGDAQLALAELDRAAALAPDSASVFDSRGYARYLAGDYQGAIADVNRALALVEPFSRASRAEMLYHRALVRAALGDLAGAEESAREAETLRPVPLVARGIEELLQDLAARWPAAGAQAAPAAAREDQPQQRRHHQQRVAGVAAARRAGRSRCPAPAPHVPAGEDVLHEAVRHREDAVVQDHVGGRFQRDVRGRAGLLGAGRGGRVDLSGDGGDDADGVDLTDAVVRRATVVYVRVGEEDVAALANREAARLLQGCLGCQAAVADRVRRAGAAFGRQAAAGDRHDLPAGDTTHQVVLRVAHEDRGRPAGVDERLDRHALGLVQLGRGRFAVAVEAAASGAGDRLDDARQGGDLAHPAVRRVGDVEVACGVHRDVARRAERRAGGRTAVSQVVGRAAARAVDAASGHAGAGDGGDQSCWGDLPDAVVVQVGDVEVALAVDVEPRRLVETRRCDEAVREAGDTLRARHAETGRRVSVRVDVADDVVQRIRDEETVAWRQAAQPQVELAGRTALRPRVVTVAAAAAAGHRLDELDGDRAVCRRQAAELGAQRDIGQRHRLDANERGGVRRGARREADQREVAGALRRGQQRGR